jgi:hypothetical protein
MTQIQSLLFVFDFLNFFFSLVFSLQQTSTELKTINSSFCVKIFRKMIEEKKKKEKKDKKHQNIVIP